jgi:hypothetical protein
MTSRYGPSDPRPILMEVKVTSNRQKIVVSDANQCCVLHGSYGPWDGTVLCVATKDNGAQEQGSHTEPLWWPARPHPLSNHIRVQDCSPPPSPATAMHELAPPNTCALIYGMQAFHGGDSAEADPSLRPANQKCRWLSTDQMAEYRSAWPTAGGTVPDANITQQALRLHGIDPTNIMRDVNRWLVETNGHTSSQSSPCIIILRGDYDVYSHPSQHSDSPVDHCNIAAAPPICIKKGGGACQVCLICHSTGHLWATRGVDTTRRMTQVQTQEDALIDPASHDPTNAAEHGREHQ